MKQGSLILLLVLSMQLQAGPLHDACKEQKPNVATIFLLLAAGAYVNELDERGEAPLHYACLRGAKEVVEVLLMQPEIEVDIRNKQGWTPLHKAAYNGSTACMEFLCNAGASKDSRENHGRTPLHLACYQSQLLAAIWLIDNGVTTSIKDAEQRTALELAYPNVRSRLEEHMLDRRAMIIGVG